MAALTAADAVSLLKISNTCFAHAHVLKTSGKKSLKLSEINNSPIQPYAV